MKILQDGEIVVFISMRNSTMKKKNCKTSIWEDMWRSWNRTLSLKELGEKLPIEVYYVQLIQSDTFVWFVCSLSWNPLWLIVNSSGKSLQYLLTALFLVLSAIPLRSCNFWRSLCHLHRWIQQLSLSLSLFPKAEVPVSSLHCSAMQPKYQQYQVFCLSRFPLCCTNLCNPSPPPPGMHSAAS